MENDKLIQQKNIYIVLSKTPTRFGSCLRKVGRMRYNHASVSLDNDLMRTYSFARPRHGAVLLGHLVRESRIRYTLGRDISVPIVVFAIPVTDEDYNWVEDTITKIGADPEFMYNLFSVLLYPFTNGFETYKAMSCIEFVMYVLQHLGYELDRRPCSYKPDDLLELLKDKICYEGDVRDIMPVLEGDEYFKPMTIRLELKSIAAVFKIAKRSILRRRVH